MKPIPPFDLPKRNVRMAGFVHDCPKCGAKQSYTLTYSKDCPDGRYECSKCGHKQE